MRLTKLLSWEEYKALGDWAVANGFYRNDPRVFRPGLAWYNRWYFNPDEPDSPRGICQRNGTFLSPRYWTDWAHLRPPLCVVCPNGAEWCVDRTSSNGGGQGWTVSGDFPDITCTPSIVARDYHGYLQNGEFTPDLDGHTWPDVLPYEDR